VEEINGSVINSDVPRPRTHKQKYQLSASWESAVSGWLIWLAASGMPKTTQRTRRGHVREIARRSETHHPRDIDLATLVRLCSEEGWSNEHRRGVRCSLIGFYDWAVTNGLCESNPAIRLPKVSARPGRPRPVPDGMWQETLIAAPERERMMVRLAGEAGMRRGEVARCHTQDLIEDLVGWSLIVHGKGGKQRIVPVGEKLALAIRRFRPNGGYLFPGQENGHLSAATVGKLVGELMPGGWTMHKLRHRYATRSLRLGANLIQVRDLLGHASVATTQIYTASSLDDLRRITDRLSED
jgi:site-specific recombinase XerD